MAKKKVFLAGEVFKLTDPVTVTEMCMQMRLDQLKILFSLPYV